MLSQRPSGLPPATVKYGRKLHGASYRPLRQTNPELLGGSQRVPNTRLRFESSDLRPDESTTNIGKFKAPTRQRRVERVALGMG